MNLIQQTVEPLRQAAMDGAEQLARQVVERVRTELAAVGNDVRACAPHPRAWNMSRNEYLKQLAKYRTFAMLTKWRETSARSTGPLFADVCEERVAHFIDGARKDAAAQYEMYVMKLINKIGAVTQADLSSDNAQTGENLWHRSILKVTKVDGSIENWKTQMIFNVSKLGKVFNQFPTRKVK